MTKPALLVSTYNWPEALAVVLNSIAAQSLLPGEVLIADDGSDERTKAVIDAFREKVPFPVKHAWQEDRGFRLSAARNRAIELCESPYIIQIDGDIVLHRHFIKDHMSVARKGYYASGQRGELSPETTTRILKSGIPAVSIRDIDNQKRKGSRKKVLRCPVLAPLFYRHKAGSFRHGIGANLAFWTDDIRTINGYDESYQGWGSEDFDVMCRLMNADVKKRSIRMKGICYHLFHTERKNDEDEIQKRNRAHFVQNVKNRVTACQNGLEKK
jgi:glycosyltransferase involved in cell wall biosynthesis